MRIKQLHDPQPGPYSDPIVEVRGRFHLKSFWRVGELDQMALPATAGVRVELRSEEYFSPFLGQKTRTILPFRKKGVGGYLSREGGCGLRAEERQVVERYSPALEGSNGEMEEIEGPGLREVGLGLRETGPWGVEGCGLRAEGTREVGGYRSREGGRQGVEGYSLTLKDSNREMEEIEGPGLREVGLGLRETGPWGVGGRGLRAAGTREVGGHRSREGGHGLRAAAFGKVAEYRGAARRKFGVLVLLCLSLLTFSCKKSGFLDQTVTTSLDESSTFRDSSNAMQFLANIYSNIGFATDPKRFSQTGQIYAAGLEAACDEAEGPIASSSYGFIQFVTGSVNPTVVPNDAWKTCYSNIRAVNQLLKHMPIIPFNPSLKVQVRAEARFLRAWYYAMLMQHYGGVPLIGDTIFASAGNIDVKRNAYSSCVSYVLSECDAAAKDLPVSWSGAQYGRITSAACLALKARVLLFAASPLFNNGGLAAGNAALDTVVAYPDSDPHRWQLAADAAKAVIALGAYQLFVDSTSQPGQKGYGFQELFTKRYNTEYILARMMIDNKYLESLWDVPSRGGAAGPYAYQEMVDAFPMSNGLDITDVASGYDPNNPYRNRDPRLDYSIIHDSTLRMTFATNQPSPVQLYINTSVNPPVPSSGDAVYKGTTTGLYIFKMMDPNVINNSLSTSPRVLPLIRYAEVLLNFAEATNEASGPTPEVYAAVEAIRQRAGLRPYQLPTGLDQGAMRAAIRKERRIELAYEGVRFFDVRRWMIAEQTDNQMMHGMEVDRGPGAVVVYKSFNVRKHNFTKAMYLWPIPLSEIAKSPSLLQNPLY